MPRNCAPRLTRRLSPHETNKVSVTCSYCGGSFQIEARHQAGAVGRVSKFFCSEQCARGQDQKGGSITGLLSGLGPEDS